MDRRIISIVILFMLIMMVISGIIRIGYQTGSAYIIHAPIRINQNSDFAVYGFPGDGTNNNPWIIENYDIDGSGYGYCIYIGNTTDYFIVRNCYLHHANVVWDWPYFPRAGLGLYNVQHGNIENNTVVWNARYGISLGSSGNNILMNNTGYSNNYHGIYLNQNNNNNIVDNNTMHSNTYDGISVVDSNNNDIFNNTLYGNRDGLSIYSSCTNNLIVNNIVYSNSQNGIYLYSSGSNTIVYNNAFSNSENGIYIDSLSNSNTISNNVASSNTKMGIRLDSSSNGNTIINNTVSDNLYGIYLVVSSSNVIYHNNLLYNTNQADDDMNNNFWDNGYPSGGNFWLNYGGLDNFKGPSQNITGSDGIGDSQYTIDADSRDNYPLIIPMWDYILLHKGWNLISIPFIQSDKNVGSVLSTIGGLYDAIQYYNTSDNSDHWKNNQTSKPPGQNDFENIHHIIGFWIHVTKSGATLFQYDGSPPLQNQHILLHPGWNLVGYPSLKRYNRTQALNNLNYDVQIDAIWTYNIKTAVWEELDEPSDFFQTGRGYWIHASTDCVWEVPL